MDWQCFLLFWFFFMNIGITMSLLIGEAADTLLLSMFNVDIAPKLITLLLFFPTYQQFWPSLKACDWSHTQEPESIFIPPQSFSALVLLQKRTLVFFLSCHLPDPWASSASPTRSSPNPPPASADTLHSWIFFFQQSSWCRSLTTFDCQSDFFLKNGT